jgi:hypothetical protein
MLFRVSRPFCVKVLDGLIDLSQFGLSEHNITTCRILNGTLGMPGEYVIRNVSGHAAETCTYDDPGRGMTCDPRELTQAIASCAGVIFFFLASSVIVSTIVTLCLRFWCDGGQKCVGLCVMQLLHLLGNEACDGAYLPLSVRQSY